MKKGKSLIFIVLAIILVFSLGNSVYAVQENEYACTVRFAKIIGTTGNAGLHFKVPFVDSIKVFPKAIMLYDISPSEVLTSDKQNMTVDSYVLWSITDPLLFYQALGSITVAEERLDALTYNAFKNLIGKLAQSDIINQEDASIRKDIYSGLKDSVGELANNYGVDIVDIRIKRFDLPEANEAAVFSRMISERNQMAERFTADGTYEAALIRNDVDKQVNIIVSNARALAAALEAEGEAEYMRMLADAYDTDDKREFYKFILALDALEKSLNGNEKTIILGPDSELAKILISP